MIDVAVVSVQGVPACYGGFESLVENLIGECCSSDIHYMVFCSSREMPSRLPSYKNATLEYLPLSSHGALSVIYDTLSFAKSIRRYDVVLVLGATGGIFFPLLKLFAKAKIILNVDGLEHRRDKWNLPTRMFLSLSERMAVMAADTIISDNEGISDFVRKCYGRDSHLIAYGGDHALRSVSENKRVSVLSKYGIKDGEYSLSICRIEPENNCHLTLEAFSHLTDELVFVGNWNKSDYGKNLKERYSEFPNIHIVDAVYDLDELYVLRSSMKYYIHGHSVGGTNPSLVEAMFFGRPILAFDVVYNRATTGEMADFYSSSSDLVSLIESGAKSDGRALADFAAENYTWAEIVSRYESLY